MSDCPAYWQFKGVRFPCDLEMGHSGPHINYPKKDGHVAIIIWSTSRKHPNGRVVLICKKGCIGEEALNLSTKEKPKE